MPMNSREDVQRVNSAFPQVRQGHEDSVKLHHDFVMIILTNSVLHVPLWLQVLLIAVRVERAMVLMYPSASGWTRLTLLATNHDLHVQSMIAPAHGRQTLDAVTVRKLND